MRISDAFRAVHRAVFQDKTIAHRPASKQTGSLGSVTIVPGDITSTYAVNFQLISDALVAQEWGLVVARDAFATSSDALPIEIGDFVQYDSKVYRVTGHPVFDSHEQLMLQLTSEAATTEATETPPDPPETLPVTPGDDEPPEV